jgi:GDP/UDP-N,N'-diacetylbacillosamine 2-epimerase (hydrolysing)
MRKIAVVTGTRAEYGLMKNIIRKLHEDNELELQLIVTGSHLSERYGYTINEIIEDGFQIDEQIPILMDSNDGESVAKSMGLLHLSLSQAFRKLRPDIVLILGDRYEIFAVASVAMMMNIPIAHISGGEVTEGAIDDQIRHAITKMAHIHFPGAKIYANNVKNMGEESWRIFNVGDPGIENIKLTNFLSKQELEKEFCIEINEDVVLMTYHPVTLEQEKLSYQIDNLLQAISQIDKNFIITYPNSDNGGMYIINRLEEFANNNNNIHLVKNLGSKKYLSIMRLCGVVVGNSSSALVEAPFLKKPVVNIGSRQRGRIMASNIICCDNDCKNIVKAINRSLSNEFKESVKNTISLYGEGNSSDQIVKVLKNITIDKKLLNKKLIWS